MEIFNSIYYPKVILVKLGRWAGKTPRKTFHPGY
jgi:hypothetical protein